MDTSSKLVNETTHNNKTVVFLIMSHYVYTRTTEPSISSYIDIKTGLHKFRIFISFRETNMENVMVHKLSKNYNSLYEAERFGSILRDILEFKGNVDQNTWEACRVLPEMQLCQLVRECYKEKVSICRSKNSSALFLDGNELIFNCSHTNFEEAERSVEWWEVNIATFLSNKEYADNISASVVKNSEFAMLSPKLYRSYIRKQKNDFFLNMSDYVDPLTGEVYFTFKTDLMTGIFTTDEICACKNQYLLTMCEYSLNGEYMCAGMRKIVRDLQFVDYS